MSSAAEDELGALYINAREAAPQCQMLAEMGHKEPPTPMQTDNSTARGVVNNNIQTQHTQAMDMRLHWLRCCKAQCQFRFFWCPGTTNRADYRTKHHCAAHHIKKCLKILTPKIVLGTLRTSAKCTPDLIPAQHTQMTKAAAATKIFTQHYIAVLKGCVRYPLSNYAGIWNSHVGTLPLCISGTWHSIVRMAEKYNFPPHH